MIGAALGALGGGGGGGGMSMQGGSATGGNATSESAFHGSPISIGGGSSAMTQTIVMGVLGVAIVAGVVIWAAKSK